MEKSRDLINRAIGFTEQHKVVMGEIVVDLIEKPRKQWKSPKMEFTQMKGSVLLASTYINENEVVMPTPDSGGTDFEHWDDLDLGL